MDASRSDHKATEPGDDSESTWAPDPRWQRINEVVLEALELEGDAREAFVSDACAGDADLRREVASLLDVDEEVIKCLDQPAVSLTGPGRAELETGSWIGPFQVIRELGRGGMGTVYLAARAGAEPVAVKLLKATDGLRMARTFHREIQALVQLEHPTIVRLLDVGAEGERPYLVMEAVDGEPIDRYCEHHRLDLRQRFELFLEVCDGVAFAHRNLVVHRDLKPTNILVDAAGEPKLLDFGVAKLLDVGTLAPRTVTDAGHRLLTPEYASPELLRGEPVSVSNDIYALGVLLYELVTGCPPYRLESYGADDLWRAICDTAPTPPSTLIREWQPRQWRRERLDRVVLMALAKEPEARYASVDALAEDLRRLLVGRPVRAPRVTTPDARPLVSWRQTVLGGIGAAAVVLLVAWLINGGLEQSPTDSAADSATKADTSPVVADLLYAQGQMAYRLGQHSEAEALLARALASRRAEHGDVHPEVAASLHELALAQTALGKGDSALELLREAFAIRQAVLGAEHLDTQRTAIRLAEVEAEHTPFDAERQARRTLGILRRHMDATPSDIALAEGALGAALLGLGEIDEAEPLLISSERELTASSETSLADLAKARARLDTLAAARTAATPAAEN